MVNDAVLKVYCVDMVLHDQVEAAKQAILEMAEPDLKREREAQMEQAVKERMNEMEANVRKSNSKAHGNVNTIVELNLSKKKS